MYINFISSLNINNTENRKEERKLNKYLGVKDIIQKIEANFNYLKSYKHPLESLSNVKQMEQKIKNMTERKHTPSIRSRSSDLNRDIIQILLVKKNELFAKDIVNKKPIKPIKNKLNENTKKLIIPYINTITNDYLYN